MALFRSFIYLIGFGGLGYSLMKITAKDDKYQIPTDYSSRNESLKKRQAVVDVLRRAAENKDPMYRQTKEEIDSLRTDDATKKRS